MSEEKPVQDDLLEEEKVIPSRKQSRSAFAPIVLIAAGVFFLLANLGVVGALDWQTAWRFWPLALIFLGLNVLVVQTRPPLGTALSAIVALAAVSVFGYLLLSGAPDEVMRSIGVSAERELHDESFWVPLDGVETAEITIDLSNFPAEIGPLDDGGLIGGTIYTYGELITEFDLDDGHARYKVGDRSSGFWFDPGEWFNQEERAWTIGLDPGTPIDLTIDAGNGSATAELSQLTLSHLTVDAANGGVSLALPDGDYDMRLDGGNGSIAISLPDSGVREIRVDGGNGGITLQLPDGVEARVEYETGNGSLRVDNRFERVTGDDDEGVYETSDYQVGGEGVLLIVESSNGSVRIESP